MTGASGIQYGLRLLDCLVKADTKRKRDEQTKTVFELKPGERGRVTQINAQGAIRTDGGLWKVFLSSISVCPKP